MKTLSFIVFLLLSSVGAHAAIVFSRPPSDAGGLILSSWVDPNGSDSDMYAYDEFTLASSQSITEVDWRGGYTQNAFGGRAFNFSITFFESIAGGSEPHVGNPQLEDTTPVYLAKYYVGGNAGETPAGTSALFDYKFNLPTPFAAAAGVKYWLRIEASQPTYPDWGIAVGAGGDGQYFRFSTGAAMFQTVTGDTAFTLLNAAAPETPTTTSTPTDTVSPTNTATPTMSSAPTPTPCVGDCGGNGLVTVDELLTMVNIALGNANTATCLAGDANRDGQITVDEIVAAVDHALNGCVG